jgi:hypothetical protein
VTGQPYNPDREFIAEDHRAVLCSIWAGHGEPVRNPALVTNMHAIAWSTSEAGALNLAQWACREGLAAGNPATGYTLTEAGRALLDRL